MNVNRRSFLKSGAAAAALAPAIGFPAVVKRRNANELLSHACVGTANMAGADMNGIAAHRDVHITALCDVDSVYLERAHKRFPDARVYRNAHEMFAAEGNRIDSANVSTPDHSHAGYVLDALGRGLNVYAQKPLCHDIADCRRIESLAALKKSVTQMGTQIAAWECDRQTAAYLRQGAIGAVRHVWIFSNRGGQTGGGRVWPLPTSPVPETLDWKTWLASAPARPYAPNVYHPGRWRRWRDFGTSWLGDLGLHLLSPVWIGLGLGTAGPVAVTAEIPDDGWSDEWKRQFWPRMSHLVWEMPGVKSSGGQPFPIEWCDGNLVNAEIKAATPQKFFPPAFIAGLFAKSPIGEQPLEGRVVEGTEGWLLSVHYNKSPVVVMKNGGKPPALPHVGPAPSHWHEWVDCCLQGGTPTSSFAWAGRLSEMVLTGNAAMDRPGVRLAWNAKEGRFA